MPAQVAVPCEGRVRGTWTIACGAQAPSRARRSMFGVSTFVAPYTPTRSARSVSIVTISTLDATAGGAGGAGACVHAAPSANATNAHAALTNISADRSGFWYDSWGIWKCGNVEMWECGNVEIS